MLSYETTRLLKTLLETIYESEIIIERQRQTLCQHPRFAPYSAFCRIDRRARESLEPIDIQAYVLSNGSQSSIPECSKLVRYFDSDGDGILSYGDFIQMVLPCDNNELRLMVQKRPYTRVGRFDSLEYEIECGLSSIIKHELDLIFRIENLIRDLERCPDFSPHTAFRAVDRYEEGKITKEILIDFFRQFSNYLSEQEIYAIIRRIDTDGDAEIGFAEWCDFLKSELKQEAQSSRSIRSEPKQNSSKKILSNRKQHVSDHRCQDFATPSALDAVTMQLIDEKPHITKHARMMAALARAEALQQNPIRPRQSSSIKKVHFSSPLRRNSPERSENFSPVRTVMSSGIAARSTLPSTLDNYTGSWRFETEEGLVQMLNEHIALERGLERAKQELIKHADFNLFDAFRIFDVDGVGSVSTKEFFYGLADIGVHTQIEDVDLFFQRYNKKRSGRIDFGEFAASIDPTDTYYASMLARRPSSERRLNIYKKNDLFLPETAHCFKELLLTHLRVESSAESLRQHLSKNPFFEVSAAFDLIDMSGRGIVTKDEIRLLMERRGHFISDSEARSVAKKFDLNGDGVI